MTPILALRDIVKFFPEENHKPLPVLKHISLEIHPGEFFVLLGPSGSGKSTLLRIMSGLEKTYRGQRALADGLSNQNLSFVFQQFALLPWLTVRNNVGLGLMARQLPDDVRAQQVADELHLFGLERFAEAYPKELSGGMRQRVGLARAFCTSPKIVFMDEPFSELDSFTAEELRLQLLNVWRQKQITIIMVSHNIEEALELADRIAVLTPLPGQIEKIITNQLPRPRNKRLTAFYKLYDELYELVKP